MDLQQRLACFLGGAAQLFELAGFPLVGGEVVGVCIVVGLEGRLGGRDRVQLIAYRL